jgi:hypothetical protein
MSNESGISPLIAIPIILAIVAGSITYVVFTLAAKPSANFQVVSISIVSAGSSNVATATVQNTGILALENVTVAVTDDTGADVVLAIGNLAPGQTGGAENWQGRWTPGSTYIVKVTATAPGIGELLQAFTTVARG